MLRILILALMAITHSGLAYAQSSPSHILAFLRYDGIVVPMAALESAEWRNITKSDLDYLEEQKPIFYHYSDEEVERLSIDSLAHLDWEMATQYGFFSSYSRSEPTNNCCYPQWYEGGAFTWQSVAPIQFHRLREGDTKFVQYDSLVVREVDVAEMKYIDRGKPYERNNEFYSNGIPIRKSLRDSLQLDIKYQYTDQHINESEIIFFSASKRYPAEVCGLGMKLEGWIIRKARESSIYSRSFSTGDCDGKGYDSSMDPYFAFTLNGKVYVAAVIAFYEGEGKQLFEVGETGIKPLLKEWGLDEW